MTVINQYRVNLQSVDYVYIFRFFFLQMKRKLPKVKVNQDLAERILENEEAENEKKDNDGNESKKTSKRKKNALSTEIFKDDRFTQMFENKV